MRRILLGERGEAAVETAFLVSLVLVPLVIGVVEFGFGLRDWMSVSSASREGGRVGAAAGDYVGADCTILEAAAGSLTAIDDDRLKEVWIYKSGNTGTIGQRQRYRPALPTDAPGSRYCVRWFPLETNWPSTGSTATVPFSTGSACGSSSTTSGSRAHSGSGTVWNGGTAPSCDSSRIRLPDNPSQCHIFLQHRYGPPIFQ
jgi:hypothetical protein